MSFWLLKTEPGVYSFQDLQREGKTVWEGVSNFLALRHLRSMKKGDAVFIYHSGKEKAVVGVADVVSNPYPDPKRKENTLTVVDIKSRQTLSRAVTLKEIKTRKQFASFDLVRLPRLSVMPVSSELWKALMRLAEERSIGEKRAD